MKTADIEKSIFVAKVFVARAEKVLEERKMVPSTVMGSKNSGSLRRVSMELTRILAKMRNPE